MVDGEGVEHLAIPLLSLIMLVVGGIPSYIIYVMKRLDATVLMARYPPLRLMYTFFWNRWYINSVYYRLFVHSLLRLSIITHNVIELKCFEGFNRRFAKLVKDYSRELFAHIELATFEQFNINISSLFKVASRLTRRLQTGYLSYNLSEMVIGLVLLILLSLLITLGGVGT